jgi:hypothetical protein
LPSVIIYPLHYLPVANTAQMRMLDAFAADLMRISKVQAKKISIADEWHHKPPREANGNSLHDYLKDVSDPYNLYGFNLG